jgi:RNA polymerase sigma-70 factor (ECF subfamily)
VLHNDDVEFDLADCVASVRQGDEIAGRRLVEHLYPLVARLVRTHLPRRGSEEELAQDVFLKMFAALDQYQGAVPIEHWVSRIAVNHCVNAIRAQKSRPEWRMADLPREQAELLEGDAWVNVDERNADRVAAARDLVETLLEALQPEDRVIIRMLEMEDRSVAEVQQLTGWSATMIRMRAFRARRKLNQRFAKLRAADML